MAKAKKLPSGQWRTLVYHYTDENGKRHYESFTADSKKESEYMAAEFAMNKKNSKCPKNMTFGDALDQYIVAREPVSSPRTIQNYRRIRKNDIQSLMYLKIRNITQEDIQAAINEDSRKHSPKTVRDNHGLISAVMKMHRPDFALNTVLPKKIRPDLYIPSNEDVKKLMEYAKGTEMELPIMLAAFGPMRRGEIAALTSDCITGNTVHVKKNMVLDGKGSWIIKAPKSYSGDRYITFPDFVADKWKGIEGRLTQLTPDNISCRFYRLVRNCDMPNFRFHDLRHYCASIQHAIGAPDAYIMERGGWGSDGVLKSVYRHTLEQEQVSVNTKINDYFSNMQHEMQHNKKEPC